MSLITGLRAAVTARVLLAALGFAMIYPLAPAEARGPAYSARGKIVAVQGRRVSITLYYLETAPGQRTLMLVCGVAFGEIGRTVQVVGTLEPAGICADSITPVD